MMTPTNWLTYYPNWVFGYPVFWLQWQRSVFGNWFDIWAKTNPKVMDKAGKTITFQEKWINSFLEIEEKTINQTLETQKQFWHNYFQMLEPQKNQTQNNTMKMAATLEPFPSSANLEPFSTSGSLETFPTSAKVVN